ncbi:MAG: hypothetical protein ACAI35_18400, partial [Candidatus Methylacidiphilales bacterium]
MRKAKRTAFALVATAMLAAASTPLLVSMATAEPAPAVASPSIGAPAPGSVPAPAPTPSAPLVTDPSAIDTRLQEVLTRPEYTRKRQEDTFSK